MQSDVPSLDTTATLRGTVPAAALGTQVNVPPPQIQPEKPKIAFERPGSISGIPEAQARIDVDTFACELRGFRGGTV